MGEGMSVALLLPPYSIRFIPWFLVLSFFCLFFSGAGYRQNLRL